MRFALLLGLFSAVQAFLHENFNGIVDGNTCTAASPPSGTSTLLFQVPTNASVAFPIGTVLTVLNIGAGTCTIKAVTSGTTTVLSAGAVAAQPTLGQYKSAACIKTATDTWYVVGAIA